ncbi:MAG: hypothetical protein ACR2QK_05645 [Acidimicrobiales bacterium]
MVEGCVVVGLAVVVVDWGTVVDGSVVVVSATVVSVVDGGRVVDEVVGCVVVSEVVVVSPSIVVSVVPVVAVPVEDTGAVVDVVRSERRVVLGGAVVDVVAERPVRTVEGDGPRAGGGATGRRQLVVEVNRGVVDAVPV